MSPRSILLIQKNSATGRLRPYIDSSGAVDSVETIDQLKRRISQKSYALIIIEAREDWFKEVQRLRRQNGALHNTTILIAPPNILEYHPDCLRILSRVALGSANSDSESKVQDKIQEELTLRDFVDRKLSGFIRHMKTGGVRNLYSMLIAEVERPLIGHILKETNGNQIQAAQLLGMNRNTLRKKIKELKIPLSEPTMKKKGQESA